MTPLHLLLAGLVAAVWGFNFVVIKIGLGSFPPLLFSALRFLLAAVPLVFFLPRPKVAWRYVLAIGLVLGVVKFSLLFVGMAVGAPAGLASLVLQVQAFFTLILAALLLRERPNGPQIIGMLLAFAGIGLIALTIDNRATPLGLVLVIGAALAWACSNLLMKKVGQVDMLHLMVHVSLVAPLPLFMMSLAFEGWEVDRAALANLSWQGAGAVLYVAFGATIFGFAIWGKLIRTYGAGRIAPFSLLVPVFGMSSAALVLGEEFGPLRIAAAALVIAGLVLTVVRRPTAPDEAKAQPKTGIINET